jgi:hypothetical protein
LILVKKDGIYDKFLKKSFKKWVFSKPAEKSYRDSVGFLGSHRIPVGFSASWVRIQVIISKKPFGKPG